MKADSANLDQKWSVTINITRLLFLCQSQAKPGGNSKVEAMDERVIWQGQLSSVILLTFGVNSPDLAGWLRVISIRPHYPMGIPFETPWMIIKKKMKREPFFHQEWQLILSTNVYWASPTYQTLCLIYTGKQHRLESYALGKDIENKKETKSTKILNGNTCNEEKYGDIR